MEDFSKTTIDDYLMGNLTGVALVKFEEALRIDAALAEEVEKHRLALEVVDGLGDQQMMKRINRIHAREMKLRNSILPSSLLKYAAAAIVLLASGIGLWNWLQPPSSAELFAKYYSPPTINFTQRGDSNPATLAKANEHFAAGQYQSALDLLAPILADSPEFSKVEFAMAICEFELGNEPKALEVFSNLANKEFELYQDHSIWYLTLLYLKSGRMDLAEDSLRVLLSHPPSPFHEKATELYAQLTSRH